MIDINQAIVYDVETIQNCFTLTFEELFSERRATFEISEFRDDRAFLFQWFEYWRANSIPMIGFNNLSFDYPILHQIYCDPYIGVDEIYAESQNIIEASFVGARFNIIRDSDRFAPQIDLLRIHHFDNRAKATSLKALQFAMRSESVMEMPLAHDAPVSREDVDRLLVPYNRHDVSETKRFALISLDAIKFRIGLAKTLRGDVLNFNDTKIGAKILEQRLGYDLCYDENRQPRQTPRTSIPLADIIFPFITFREPEFQRVLAWMREQTLTVNELTESLQTKGVFTGVKATVGGLDFHFGTGGIHGSVSAQRFAATDDRIIVDIDVASLYPSIAISNRLYPEHLGERFVEEYAQLPIERKKHKKGTVENAAFKLASNGTYGNSNNKFSCFYDPKFTMAITINGQLMLCMLAEELLRVPTLDIIQINTDGITYRVHPVLLDYTRRVRSNWEKLTGLVLEEAHYGRMWIRDVNNYVAETTDGKLKQKGAYWFPRKFPEDITNAAPPSWHKDFSAQVVIMAAVEHMTRGTDIERFVYGHRDPFDFMCRAKVDRSSQLWIGDRQVQRITRYFIARNGHSMRKVSPPAGPVGTWKRRNGLSDFEYHSILQTLPPGQWDERIHTKNRSKYEKRETSIEAGWLVAECNRAADFDFENLNYDWYVEAAKKLVIP